MICLINLLIN